MAELKSPAINLTLLRSPFPSPISLSMHHPAGSKYSEAQPSRLAKIPPERTAAASGAGVSAWVLGSMVKVVKEVELFLASC
jgi:hypothetical protein